MYQALYRKYRSQTFAEMVGQTVVAKALKQAVSSGKVSHAYLFSGPRGTGKTSAAKIFAKAMNCPNQSHGEPCNACDICQDITKGSLEDVIEIDAASNNGVDEIRDIRDKSTYAPSRASYKVYIIDEVHMLSTGAFNALLKTLEEPTDHVVFILATTELHKIPATILSRVQRFEFKAIGVSDISQHLEQILTREGLTYDPLALTLIAKRAEGGMRDALSMLDQALSLTQEKQLDLATAEEITGSISLKALDAYVSFISQGQVTQALSEMDLIFNSGKSMSRFATDLLNYLRDLLLAKAGVELSQLSQGFQDNLVLSQERLFTMIDQVTDGLQQIKAASYPKIYAEMMTMRLAQTSEPQNNSLDLRGQIEQELEQLRQEVLELKNRLSTTDSQLPPAKPLPKPSSFKVNKEKILMIMAETVEDSQKSRQYLGALKEAWQEILESLSAQEKALLMGSEPVLANAEHAILAFDAAFNAEQAMRRSDLNTIFGNVMSQVAGFSPQIMAVPRADFNLIRQEFAQKHRQEKEEVQASQEPALLPEGFQFLQDKIRVIND
ncbi:DNA polymerase III subunit gamma/tau [Streptococcus cuniculipharyngis]|uniref:DNA-directed DNA polymerase n=1 Tax=Streptococcus cuniculipharyngis TaxID=1562651 RepID=A0A5C5SF84_9STRE|nr:DNA polymerase III subunit gamma/tau [Streptococcus cuniculipharyngis]TWS98705.1 DNA polymerase III subunit gamma/tau [Streptococcus cuniculipharyngis]